MVLGHPLAKHDHVLRVITEGGGARQHADIVHRRKRRHGLLRPVVAGIPSSIASVSKASAPPNAGRSSHNDHLHPTAPPPAPR